MRNIEIIVLFRKNLTFYVRCLSPFFLHIYIKSRATTGFRAVSVLYQKFKEKKFLSQCIFFTIVRKKSVINCKINQCGKDRRRISIDHTKKRRTKIEKKRSSAITDHQMDDQLLFLRTSI